MPTDVSTKTRFFTESVIREMTRRAIEFGAVNLAQGFPDFAAPTELKEAAKRAIDEEYNQYAIAHGSPNFRKAIAQKARSYNNLDCDPDRNLTVTCGATEAMVAALLAVINPGDEVIIFEPFYENYGPDTIIAGATARYVALRDRTIRSIAGSSRRRSVPAPRRSSSTRRTIRQARFSAAPSWRLSRNSANATTPWRLPTKFMST
jgi:aspartate/methionine/tyrosine aminotransferase